VVFVTVSDWTALFCVRMENRNSTTDVLQFSAAPSRKDKDPSAVHQSSIATFSLGTFL
jgi:hypothetical protein